MARIRDWLCVSLLTFSFVLSVSAQQAPVASGRVPPMVRFNGVLTDSSGRRPAGPVGVTLSLYKDRQGVTPGKLNPGARDRRWGEGIQRFFPPYEIEGNFPPYPRRCPTNQAKQGTANKAVTVRIPELRETHLYLETEEETLP
jgi:hypothetical protein